MRALTVRQPWADLIVVGIKDVESRTWEPYSTLPQWGRCAGCGDRFEPDEWEDSEGHAAHASGCDGWCHGCPVHCGPIHADGPFPFRLGIHAAKSYSAQASGDVFRTLTTSEGERMDALVAGPHRLGALLGFVTVTGCHPADGRSCFEDGHGGGLCSSWAQPGQYHWKLTDPEPLDEPVPMRGQLGLWRLPEGDAA